MADKDDQIQMMIKGWRSRALVSTPDGPREIGTLRVGDTVMGWNDAANDFAPQLVVATRSGLGRATAPGAALDQEVLTNKGYVPLRKQGFVAATDQEPLIELSVIPDHNYHMTLGMISHNWTAFLGPALGLLGGLAGGAGGGKGPTQTGSTSSNESFNSNEDFTSASDRTPWDPFTNNYSTLMGAANDALANRNLDPITGKLIAKQGPLGKEANQLTIDLARKLIAEGNAGGGGGGGMPIDTTGMDELRKLALSQLAGDYLRPETNPFLTDAINLAQRRTNENFLEQVLPQLRSQAQLSGAYGGGRQGVVEARSAKSLQQTLADIATQMAYGNYSNERQIQQGSGSLLDQAQQIQARAAANARANASAANAARSADLNKVLRGIGMLSEVASGNQAQKQARIDAQLQRDLLNRQLTDPFQSLDLFGQLTSLGQPFGSTTQSGTSTRSGSSASSGQQSQQNQGSTLADILKGGMGGFTTGTLLSQLLAGNGGPVGNAITGAA